MPWDNDKPTVMALREIAEGFVDRQLLTQVVEDDREDDLFLSLESHTHTSTGF